LGRRAELDVPDARAAESKPKLAHGDDDDRPPLEEKRRCSGEGGFVFLCALAGHTEVRASPISLKILYLDAIANFCLAVVVESYSNHKI
jgi:hypothetical protein